MAAEFFVGDGGAFQRGTVVWKETQFGGVIPDRSLVVSFLHQKVGPAVQRDAIGWVGGERRN